MKSLLLALCCALLPVAAHATSILPTSAAERLATADATGVAELIAHRAVMIDGRIQTRFEFRTIEALRGQFPAYFAVHAPGGVLGATTNADSRLPSLAPEQTYLLFLQIGDHRLGFADGPAGVTPPNATTLDELRALAPTLPAGANLSAFQTQPHSVGYVVTPTGLFEGGGFRRFTPPDSGAGILVYADTSTLPAGVSEQAALAALQTALAAWEAETSVRFRFAGTQTFVKAADTYAADDGLVIRVQFHDNFGDIPDHNNTLGYGGAFFSTHTIDSQPVFGSGGIIAGRTFEAITHGYVVLDHTKSPLSNLATLEEVLGHEIGHVLGLAHSSETFSEPDTERREALMYYLAHADNRGATLNTYDISTALQAYPLNTPPVSFDRVLYAVSSPSPVLANPEVNRVTLAGFDLHGDPLTINLVSSTGNNGTFTLNGSILTYSPSKYFADTVVADPASSYYDQALATVSDGVNISPYFTVRIVGLFGDTEPSGTPDGIPDAWMTQHFGDANGSTASADSDGDGLTNLQEYLLGTDPTDTDSRFRITTYTGDLLEWTTPKRFDVFRVQTSTNLTDWTTHRIIDQPDESPFLFLSDLPSAPGDTRRFFRVQRID